MVTVIGIPEKLYLHTSTWLGPVVNQVILIPIARQRFKTLHPDIERELKRRASDRGTTPEYELCLSARLALSLVIQGLTGPTRLFDPCDPTSPAAVKYVRKKIQERINYEVTIDLLGPGWRRLSKEEPLGASDTDVDPQEQYETKLFVDGLLTDPRLSPREQELLQAMLDHGDKIADAARTLDIKPSTARKRLQRIRLKLSD